MSRSPTRRWIPRRSLTESRRHEWPRITIRRLFAETLERRSLLTAVTSVSPPADTHAAPVSTDVSAIFDQDINAASATSQTFAVHSMQRGRLLGSAAAVNTTGATVTLNPSSSFFPGDIVQASVTSGIQSTSGDPATPRVWQFRTDVPSGSGVFTDSGQLLGFRGSTDIAFGDLDGDGDLDAFVANYGGGNRAWLNRGGVFSDGQQSLGDHNSTSVGLGDLDGDGDLDAFVTNGAFNPQANRVWLNDGAGLFNDSGLSLGNNQSLSVALGDLDGDGDLDAFVANVIGGNRVWLNDGGLFSDSEQSLGNSSSITVSLGDLDQDGDLDAFVANAATTAGGDGQPNRVWLNDAGIFSDSGQAMGNHESNGVSLGDLDNDGDLDAFVVNFTGQANRVWLNDAGIFNDSGQSLGSQNSRRVQLGDLDADGDLDAFVTNGPNSRVWLNNGGQFVDSGQGMVNDNAYGAALGDVDGDGDSDAYVANFGGTNRVWLDPHVDTSSRLTIAAADSAKLEGNAGNTPFAFAVTRNGNLDAAVSVQYAVTGSGANATDFGGAFPSGVVDFAAGEAEQVIVINVTGDTTVEADEEFTVTLSDPTPPETEITIATATATIQNDDNPPTVTLQVDNTTIPEGGGVATFSATLSAVVALPVTVNLAFSGTATDDYTASGTQIVIAPGATSGSVTVTAIQDSADEPDESVIVDITSVTNGLESGTQQATTTILDDDLPVMPDVTLAVDNGSIDEDGGSATFTATLSESTTAAVTVDLALSGTATTADDYTASETQIVIAPGATSGSITVTAVDDEEDESNETVIVDIVAVTGGNEAGVQQRTTTITDDDNPPGFTIASLTATPSGFVAEFSTELDPSDLNLFDTQNAGSGSADATFVGASSGPVAGSLVVDPSLRSVTFIKSGDPLAADSYTATLRSGNDAFKDVGGQLLDGNNDGTGGDDYTGTFDIVEPAANTITVSVPDFTRGPGQAVNLPANSTNGIPVTISDGDNVRAIDLRIGYDATKLDINGATVGADVPAGATVIVNTNTPGLAIIVFFSSTALPAGSNTIVNLQASIPTADASDVYGSQQVLDLHAATISDGNDNESPVLVDDAFHLASYFADVSGNGRVNAADASQVARFAALIDSGFSVSLVTDPTVVGDISGNGRINAADASRVARFAALIAVPEIPPIPAGVAVAGVVHLGPGLPDLGFAARRVASETSEDTGVQSGDGSLLPPVGPDPYQAVDTVMASMVMFDEDERLILALEDAMAELLSAELLAD